MLSEEVDFESGVLNEGVHLYLWKAPLTENSDVRDFSIFASDKRTFFVEDYDTLPDENYRLVFNAYLIQVVDGKTPLNLFVESYSSPADNIPGGIPEVPGDEL